ncbi:hypothetical protein TEA_010048 [Camellia sinensis var. sinensis]|uniref:Uncharacterized protein n=1 Tax=Camellia sinensis var. sinensis TaxID=542762 RepID=A0A4S4DFU7_CAMSN|nr:hypothetical protein TEA_010048 [Camellia sinensis var. sinensis]
MLHVLFVLSAPVYAVLSLLLVLSGIPMLKNRLQELPDSDNISIDFPDDGAWKLFHKQLQHFPMQEVEEAEDKETLVDTQQETEPKEEEVPLLISTDQTEDLMGLNEINPKAVEVKESNALALAIVPPDEGCKRKDDVDSVAKQYDLSAVALPSSIKVAQRKELSQCNSREVVDTAVEEIRCDVEVSRPTAIGGKETMMEERAPCTKNNDHSQRCVVHASAPGLFKNISGSIDGFWPSINLEIALGHPNNEQIVQGPILMPFEQQGISKYSSKFVIFRPAAVARAHSKLSEGEFEGESSSHSYLLKEAQATVKLRKDLGINFCGQEDGVVDKILELALKDKERLGLGCQHWSFCSGCVRSLDRKKGASKTVEMAVGFVGSGDVGCNGCLELVLG